MSSAAERFRTDINPALLYHQALLLVPDYSEDDRKHLFEPEWRNKIPDERYANLVAPYGRRSRSSGIELSAPVAHRPSVEMTDQLDELLICRLDFAKKIVAPCTVVIFGASGDLTARKLIPALFHLFIEKQLPNPVRIVGFARREKTHESWRNEMGEAFKKFSRTKSVDEGQWQEFAKSLFYCQGEFGDEKA